MFLCRTHLCAIEGYSNIAYQITQELFLSDPRPLALSLARLETICAYDVVIINRRIHHSAHNKRHQNVEHRMLFDKHRG